MPCSLGLQLSSAECYEDGCYRGLGVYYTITIIRNPHNSIGNYLGPYVRMATATVTNSISIATSTRLFRTEAHTWLSWEVVKSLVLRATVETQACSGKTDIPDPPISAVYYTITI